MKTTIAFLFLSACSGAPFSTAETTATDPPQTVRPAVVAVSTNQDSDADSAGDAATETATVTAEATTPETSVPTPPEAGVSPEAAVPVATACQPYTLAGPFIQLTLAPTTLDFGDVPVGQSAVLSATLTNEGTCTGPTQAAGGAPENPVFVVETSCGGGRVLAPGESCSIDVTFTPASAGQQAAVSAWTFAGEPFTITLRGVGR